MVTKCMLDDFIVKTAVKGGRGSLVVIYNWEGDFSWMAANVSEQPSGRRDKS
jgi:hypothetical protein